MSTRFANHCDSVVYMCVNMHANMTSRQSDVIKVYNQNEGNANITRDSNQ
jgi:hypothetical protein